MAVGELIVVFISRCNYVATLEGLILSKHFRNYLNKRYGSFGGILSSIWWLHVNIMNVIDDGMVISLSLISVWQHKDLFNLGLLLGKALKLTAQLYLEGYVLKRH
jgi:hypothetical protein